MKLLRWRLRVKLPFGGKRADPEVAATTTAGPDSPGAEGTTGANAVGSGVPARARRVDLRDLSLGSSRKAPQEQESDGAAGEIPSRSKKAGFAAHELPIRAEESLATTSTRPRRPTGVAAGDVAADAGREVATPVAEGRAVEAADSGPRTGEAASQEASEPALARVDPDAPAPAGDPASVQRTAARQAERVARLQKAVAPAALACPNCGGHLEHKPHIRTPCPHCGRIIHVRARQRLFPSGLVAEDEVDTLDFLERLEMFGITESRCRERLEELAPPAGNARGRLAEVVWSLCEQRLAAVPLAQRARLLEEMALFRKWRGQEYLSLRRQAAAAHLARLKDAGARRVRIAARGDAACPACAAVSGRELDVEIALAGQPLPVAECSRADGLCRCVYVPV